MAQATKAGSLVIHACPSTALDQVNAVLSGYEISVAWAKQPLLDSCLKTEVDFLLSETACDELVVKLNTIHCLYLDLYQAERFFMIVPGLGIYSAGINQAGQIQISEQVITSAIEQAAGNYRELTRLLRIALGQSWDDLLEPFRASRFGAEIVLLNRAV